MYEVIGLPPSLGADHESMTSAFPGIALSAVGVEGAAGGGPASVVVVVDVPGTVVGPPPGPIPEPPGAATVDVVDAPPAPFPVSSPPGGTTPPPPGLPG